MSDGIDGEKFHSETRNIEDLVKRKGKSDTSSTTTMNRTRLAIYNRNKGWEGVG